MHDLEFLFANALAADDVAAAVRTLARRLVRVRDSGWPKGGTGHIRDVRRAYHRQRILEDEGTDFGRAIRFKRLRILSETAADFGGGRGLGFWMAVCAGNEEVGDERGVGSG